MKKKITIFIMSLMIFLITSCGTKTDNESTEKTKENVMENSTSSQKVVDNEIKTDTMEKMEIADMKFDESKVKSVIIAEGNTGDRIEIDKSNAAEIVQKINAMKFTNIDSEDYTGWKYSIEITYENDENIDITITSNKKIQCLNGQTTQFYETDDDIVELVDKYYKAQ